MDEALLRTLPAALLAEAQALRERHMRMFREPPLIPRQAIHGFRMRGARAVPSPADLQAARLARINVGAAGQAPGRPQDSDSGVPQMSDDDLVALIKLLRVPQPLFKTQLQRLFSNLCAHRPTCCSILRILMSTLQPPASPEADAVPALPAAAAPCVDTPMDTSSAAPSGSSKVPFPSRSSSNRTAPGACPPTVKIASTFGSCFFASSTAGQRSASTTIARAPQCDAR